MNTPTINPHTAAMAAGRRADTARRRQRVIKALNNTTGRGEEISVSAIARAASVDRSFLYRHRDLLGQIHALTAQPARPGTAATPSRASLQADLLAAQQRTVRLAARNRQLEQRLSELLGEQTWHASGLGAPDDIDQLKQRGRPHVPSRPRPRGMNRGVRSGVELHLTRSRGLAPGWRGLVLA